MYGMLRDFIKFITYKKCVIDDVTFRLHYRHTFSILMIASLLTTANQFIGGNNINCMVEQIPQNVIDSFCWIQGTYTIPSQAKRNESVMDGASSPTGADDPNGDPTKKDSNDEVHHTWYQWVCVVLFLQGMMCYLPHHLWKSTEGGKLSQIIEGLDKPIIMKDTGEKRKAVVDYLKYQRKNGTHSMYANKYIICQFINLFNVLLQVYLMDVFLGNQFTTYGTDVFKVSQLPVEERYDPMSKVFPRVTKCTWTQYGQSGSKEIRDAICILPINIINEKIYIGLWFWFMILIVWTTIYLMFEMTLVCSYELRLRYLSYICRSTSRAEINLILHRCNYGDWFFMTRLAKHIDPQIFHAIIMDLTDNIVNERNRSLKDSEVA